MILKFIWKCKGSRIAKAILRKNNRGGLRLPDKGFFFFFLTTEIETVVLVQGRETGKWKRTKSPETDACINGQIMTQVTLQFRRMIPPHQSGNELIEYHTKKNNKNLYPLFRTMHRNQSQMN